MRCNSCSPPRWARPSAADTSFPLRPDDIRPAVRDWKHRATIGPDRICHTGRPVVRRGIACGPSAGSVASGGSMTDSSLSGVVRLADEVTVSCPALVPARVGVHGFRFPPEVIVAAVDPWAGRAQQVIAERLAERGVRVDPTASARPDNAARRSDELDRTALEAGDDREASGRADPAGVGSGKHAAEERRRAAAAAAAAGDDGRVRTAGRPADRAERVLSRLRRNAGMSTAAPRSA